MPSRASSLLYVLLAGCHDTADASTGAKSDAVPVVAAATIDAGPTAPPGMIWIPTGTLKAGTPKNKAPRIPDEEMAGVDVSLNGYYIDALPYPNEVGAIPTSNVSRDEAEQLCAAKGKRLCSELEWEHACKGAANASYEYGDDYAQDKCGTGVTAEEAARRPTGDRIACKSDFGVREMHGGPWEWTSSAWGRGHKEDLGVLRGGNAVAGELVGRCANAIGRTPSTKSPVMGFRCCKGETNPAKVELSLTQGRALEQQLKPENARIGRMARQIPNVTLPDTNHFFVTSAWTWRPSPNETLILASGCAAYENNIKPVGCALFAFRPDADPKNDQVLAGVAADVGIGEMVIANGARQVRVRGLLSQGGLYARELTYVYGRVVIGDKKFK
jgi:formylglycine-generating enzyme required for sulfatase activity